MLFYTSVTFLQGMFYLFFQAEVYLTLDSKVFITDVTRKKIKNNRERGVRVQ